MAILIVDNDENTVETLKAALISRVEYKIDAVYGGKEALEKMRKNRAYKLLILDIMMPEPNGIDVCKVMTQDKKLKNIPVLLISALPVYSKAFRESQEKFNELSVVKDVLEKPFSIDELIVRVKAIVAK